MLAFKRLLNQPWTCFCGWNLHPYVRRVSSVLMERLCRQALISAVHIPTVSLSLIFCVCQAGREMWNMLASSGENEEMKQEFRAVKMNTF